MRWAWVDDLAQHYGYVSHPLIWEKVKHYNLQGLSFRPEEATPEVANYVHEKNLAMRIHRAGNWDAFTPEDLAIHQSQDITNAECDKAQCALCGNLETKDFQYVLSWLKKLTSLRPGRQIVWMPEGHQANIMPVELIHFISMHKLVVVAPEIYDGDMNPLPWTPSQLRQEFVNRGIPEAQVKLTYGGNLLNYQSQIDGAVFTFEMLP